MPSKWLAAKINADKVLVQKSGYYSRAAAANAKDLNLIKSCVDLAVDCALRGESGLIGHDEEQQNRLRAIEFDRIKGGKPFNIDTPGFADLLKAKGGELGDEISVRRFTRYAVGEEA